MILLQGNNIGWKNKQRKHSNFVFSLSASIFSKLFYFIFIHIFHQPHMVHLGAEQDIDCLVVLVEWCCRANISQLCVVLCCMFPDFNSGSQHTAVTSTSMLLKHMLKWYSRFPLFPTTKQIINVFKFTKLYCNVWIQET